MKVFITGSESFVGRELIEQCKEAGIEVTGIDLMEHSAGDYAYTQGDIRTKEIGSMIPEGVDALIHLAAISRDMGKESDAYAYFDVNVLGTLNMIRAAKERNAKQFIFASSEWVYEKFVGNEEKDENTVIDIAGHTSEYALSKLVSEANLRIQYKNGFCNTTILRFGIIYGPRKAPPSAPAGGGGWSAVESVMSQVKNQDDVTIGSLKTGRRFVHVKDIARGIVKAFGLQGFEIINLCGDRLITLDEIIEESEKILSKKVKITESNSQAVSIRNPSNGKAKKVLGWQPEITLEEGLKSLMPFV